MIDNSGVKESCKLIDSVIEFILDNITEISTGDVISDLEEIREINKDLRKWGNKKFETLEEIYNTAKNAI